MTADREVGETPKLIDFGLAKIAAVAGTEQLTRTGQIIGTPSYMSPEQISGRDVDARSDVYALACLLYEMIAGRPPFTGSDDVQTLYRQLHEPPEPLSLNAANIPAALDRVINRALAKSPHDRYGSMQELARALNAAVEKRRGVASEHTLQTTITGGRRSPLPLAAAFVFGVALHRRRVGLARCAHRARDGAADAGADRSRRDHHRRLRALGRARRGRRRLRHRDDADGDPRRRARHARRARHRPRGVPPSSSTRASAPASARSCS